MKNTLEDQDKHKCQDQNEYKKQHEEKYQNLTKINQNEESCNTHQDLPKEWRSTKDHSI